MGQGGGGVEVLKNLLQVTSLAKNILWAIGLQDVFCGEIKPRHRQTQPTALHSRHETELTEKVKISLGL